MIWQEQDFEAAVLGGIIIALATTLHLYLFGKVIDASNLTYKVATKKTLFSSWQFSFFIGMITIPLIYHHSYGNDINLFGRTYALFDS